MTKSIEEQATIYQEYYSLTPNCGYHFTQGAKARDAQWSAVVNIFKSQDRLKGYPTGIEWQQLITKADQLLKEMGMK